MADDIVKHLVPFIHDEMRMPAGLIVTVIEEIERLRAAGDQLASFIHVCVPHVGWTTADRDTAAAALDAWKKARHG